MMCIHSCSGYCRKHTHDCNGKEDEARCPEWRMIQATEQLSLAISTRNAMPPGGKLKIQGVN